MDEDEELRKENWKEMERIVKLLIDFLIATQKKFKYDISNYGDYCSDSYGLATYIDVLDYNDKVQQTFIIKDNGFWVVKDESL